MASLYIFYYLFLNLEFIAKKLRVPSNNIS